MLRVSKAGILLLCLLGEFIFSITYICYHQTSVRHVNIITPTPILKQKSIPDPDQQNGPNASTIYTAMRVVDRLLQMLDKDTSFPFSLQSLYKENFTRMVLKLGRAARFSSERLRAFQNMTLQNDDPNYVRFHHGIRKLALYDPTDEAIDGLLHDLATQKIVNTTSFDKATALKMVVTFKNGGKAVFKPMRLRRDELFPDCDFHKDVERHYAEIAAFHLDKMLGFYMVPPVIGRVLSIADEIRPYVENETNSRRTFITNEVGQICIMGSHLRSPNAYSACGTPTLIEGCLKAFLPDRLVAPISSTYYAYAWPGKSAERLKPIEWKNESFCKDVVIHRDEFKGITSLLDLTDHSIFIFLKGDIDSHRLEYFRDFGKENRKLLLDSGTGFCTPVDQLILLTAVRQCCKVRYSTFLKFAKLYIGPEKLSEIVDASMRKDPLYPILVEHHLMSLDRRVTFVLQAIAECVEKSGSVTDVIIDDKL